MATPLIKDLHPDGSFAGWYNHPTEGSRPGWVSGAGPHAIRREDFLTFGGYEEMFYGYGGEDNYWLFLLKKNGFSIEYVESAVCAHQWHERMKYEPVTGYANRALINTLIMEIEAGQRPALANCQPLQIDTSVTIDDVTMAVCAALRRGDMTHKFKTWAVDCWLQGNRHPDVTFIWQREIANEGMGGVYEIGEMITEAAWALARAEEACTVAANTNDSAWATRALWCAKITHTWAFRSIERARKLMEQEKHE